MSFELRHLRYFLAVVEEGQMSRAAIRLHLAQPAVSQAIAQLERQLGVELLVRHQRGVELTDAGRSFIEEARATLVAADRALERARCWARARAAELVVGFLPGMFPVIEPVLSAFASGCPEVRVVPRQLDFSRQLAELRLGRVDVEFVLGAPSAPDLVTHPIQRTSRVVLLSCEHRLAAATALRFADVADERLPGRHAAVAEEWSDLMWMTARRGRRPPLTRETPLTPDELWPVLVMTGAIAIAPACLTRLCPRPNVVSIPLVDAEPLMIAVARRAGDDRPAVLRMHDCAATARALRDVRASAPAGVVGIGGGDQSRLSRAPVESIGPPIDGEDRFAP